MEGSKGGEVDLARAWVGGRVKVRVRGRGMVKVEWLGLSGEW